MVTIAMGINKTGKEVGSPKREGIGDWVVAIVNHVKEDF